MQYPDTISFTEGGTPAVYDENTGNWTPASGGTTITGNCRYEASSGNGWISTEGGQRLNYSGIVYLPKGSAHIKTGTKVTVTVKREGESDLVINDEVLRFYPGQMNARIWL